MKAEYLVLGIVVLGGLGVGLYFLLRPAEAAPPPPPPPAPAPRAAKSLIGRKDKLLSAGKAALPMITEIAKGLLSPSGGGASKMSGLFENVESVL